MEILLVGGLAAAGLALLLSQSKPLPTQKEFDQALEKWRKDPKDPQANLVVGKYLAFVQGDWKEGMIFLSNSNDPTLKALGEHEVDPTYTDSAVKKVGMGDEWVAAAKKFQAISPVFYDRANQWYVAAWPDLDEAWKLKARQQGRKLAVSRPIGAARKGIPSGWSESPGASGRPAVLDGNVARTGSYSVRIPAADEKVKDSGSSVESEKLVVTGKKKVEASIYVLADGTENANDRIFVFFYDQGGNPIGHISAYIPLDVPFWNRVEVKGDVPATAARAMFAVGNYSKKGNMWVDDASAKFDDKEALRNRSFEEK